MRKIILPLLFFTLAAICARAEGAGEEPLQSLDSAQLDSAIISIAEAQEAELNRNVNIYPNPSTQFTVFEVNVEKAEPVNISVYDISGALVAEPVVNEMAIKGSSFHWNHNLPSGIYEAIITAGSVQTAKIITIIR